MEHGDIRYLPAGTLLEVTHRFHANRWTPPIKWWSSTSDASERDDSSERDMGTFLNPGELIRTTNPCQTPNATLIFHRLEGGEPHWQNFGPNLFLYVQPISPLELLAREAE